MSNHTNFLGIPVEGDITRGSSRTEQEPLSDLEPLLRVVLDDPRIKAVGWNQYTPYFNDGDPCEFSVGQPWFTTAGLPRLPDEGDEPGTEDPDDGDFDEESYQVSTYSQHPTLGGRPSRWNGKSYTDQPYTGPDEQLFDRCKALSDAIEGGEFEDVLLDAFGDHASVKVTAAGITVDSYSHD